MPPSSAVRWAALSGLVAIAGLPTVHAWGAAGHEIIATIAQIHLHPSALPTICALLGVDVDPEDDPSVLRTRCHISSIATWADKERMHMRWSAAMHYVGAVDDYPRERCEFPGDQGWAGTRSINVLDATKNVTRILADWSGVNENDFALSSNSNSYSPPYITRPHQPNGSPSKHRMLKQLPIPSALQVEAFKFLVHFVGDMHQPLHLTGRARGGNSIKVHFGNRSTNLHSVWDTSIPTKLIRTVPRNYTRPLPDVSSVEEPSISSSYFNLRGPSTSDIRSTRDEDDYPGYIPPSSAQIESALRGTIYDALIRRIMWEGVRARWAVPNKEHYSEVDTWGVCPPNSTVPTRGTDQDSNVAFGNYGSDSAQVALGGANPLVPRKEPIDIGPDGPLICPYAWSHPIHKLNCDYIWPEGVEFTVMESDSLDGEHDHDHPDNVLAEILAEEIEQSYPPPSHPKGPRLPELDIPSYMGPIERGLVVEKVIAQGGLRLAGILNWLFADWEDTVIMTAEPSSDTDCAV